MLYLFLFFLPLFVIGLLVWAGGMGLGIIFGRAPYILSPRGIDEIVALELFEIRRGATVYELGSGNGHILKKISERRPDLALIGYEISPYAYVLSWCKVWGKRNIAVHYGNFFSKKLVTPAAIYFYLLPEIYPKLISYLKENALSGTLILAIDFPFSDSASSELRLLRKVSLTRHRVFIYQWN